MGKKVLTETTEKTLAMIWSMWDDIHVHGYKVDELKYNEYFKMYRISPFKQEYLHDVIMKDEKPTFEDAKAIHNRALERNRETTKLRKQYAATKEKPILNNITYVMPSDPKNVIEACNTIYNNAERLTDKQIEMLADVLLALGWKLKRPVTSYQEYINPIARRLGGLTDG